ncbi:hypothetical protein B9Z19DRAFT_576056 [Tuber borchii]|uniref:Uncharacterized protein n=1 Tax=Tuber borchii TaxID=42251 RepID=A0A2T6ZCA0_TUBBO|nr:hypothetical protein B9Z19DRAFT_576056 [Tuber borchii]
MLSKCIESNILLYCRVVLFFSLHIIVSQELLCLLPVYISSLPFLWPFRQAQ